MRRRSVTLGNRCRNFRDTLIKTFSSRKKKFHAIGTTHRFSISTGEHNADTSVLPVILAILEISHWRATLEACIYFHYHLTTVEDDDPSSLVLPEPMARWLGTNEIENFLYG